MERKVFYWCPFIDNVATVKAVINSCYGLKKYCKNINPIIINCFGEFDEYEKLLAEMQIRLINLNKYKFIKKMPTKGFIFSRLLYVVIFFISFSSLVKLIKQEKPDYFISHLITSLPLMCFNLFNFKTKHILRISGFPKLNFFRYYLWKLSNKNIHLITCPTIGTLNNLKIAKIFDPEKICLLEDPIIHVKKLKNKNEKMEEEYLKKNEFILGVGRLTKQKNFELLLNFFKIIRKDNSHLKLVIIGKGENQNLMEKFINDNCLKDRVYMLGYKKNVYKYMYNASVFVLSSKWEDPGFVLVEAAASRSFIISSDCPNGPKEILSNGNNGILFKNNDIEDLKEKFLRFKKINLNDKKKMNLSALKNIRKYTIFSHTKKLKEILI